MNNSKSQHNMYNYASEDSFSQHHFHESVSHSEETFDKKLPLTRQRIKSNSRLLPQNAINIMTAWYDKHYANPYPTYREFEQLAIAGSITVNQVKQWFVNVRRRTHNQFRKKRDSIKKRVASNSSNDSSPSFQSEMNEIFASIENVQSCNSSNESLKLCQHLSSVRSTSPPSVSSGCSNYSTPLYEDSQVSYGNTKSLISCFSSPASSNYYYNSSFYPYSGPYESTPCSSMTSPFNYSNYQTSPYAFNSSYYSSRFSASSSSSSSDSVQSSYSNSFGDPYSSSISSLYDYSEYPNNANTAISQQSYHY
jgi:hypothetical protein